MAQSPANQEVIELHAEEVTEQHVSMLAREHTERAVDVLREIMDAGQAPDMARIAASKTLLEFGHGKAPQAVLHVDQKREIDWADPQVRRQLARRIAFFGVNLD